MTAKTVIMSLGAMGVACSGCLVINVEKKVTPPPAAPAPEVVYVPAPGPTSQPVVTLSDLQSRYAAASDVSSFITRDSLMAKIAVDAAGIGEVPMTKKALSQISAFTTRDNASESAAMALASRGLRGEAVDVAKSISSFVQRDKTLAALAAH